MAPLLPGTAGSLVLVTSRRRLAALPDATVISLDILPPHEAAALLARLAGRAELCAEDAAAAEVVQLCGFLPLAIGMLASQLRHHPTWAAAQLAADLAKARDRLAMMHAESLSVAAAFDLSYQDLTPGQQRLFRRLGLVPGPTVDAYAAAALAEISLDDARRRLDELYDQHLLAESLHGRYQLHDLLREHARSLAAADDPTESDAAVGRLLDYYLHAAAAADRHFASWISASSRPRPGRPPTHAPDLSALEQAAAWLETERANLYAAADYAADRGRTSHAIAIPAAMSGFLASHGHWDQSAALHQTALTAARQAGDRLGQAHSLAELGILQRETGDYPAAAASLARAVALYGEAGDPSGQAYALNRLGFLRVVTGDYRAAAASHEQALALARSSGDRRAEGAALLNLGLVQHLTGDYPAAATLLQRALALFYDLGNLHGQALALNSLGVVQQETGDHPAAAVSQRQALALFRDLGNQLGQAEALNDIGVVQQETGDHPAAAVSLRQALALFRHLGSLGGQARAFNDLGVVQQETGGYRAAAASHQRALVLFRDLGVQLGQAEALNRLGELACRTSAPDQARERHTQALAIARDLGALPEEARALEGLGRACLQDGNPGEAAVHLTQALKIYQRVGVPAARRVQQTLEKHRLTSTTPEASPAAPTSEGHQPAHVRRTPESR